MDQGAFPLLGVANLPNVTVAFPGEHWSDRQANAQIIPGQAVMPVGSGGAGSAGPGQAIATLAMRPAASADAGSKRLAIALKTVQIPDINPGSQYNETLGPNQIVNLPIQPGEYVHAYYTGSFHLTLVARDATYIPGDLIAWDPAAVGPTGKPAVGAWAKSFVGGGAVTEAQAFAEVTLWRPYSPDGMEGILTVRSLRSQF